MKTKFFLPTMLYILTMCGTLKSYTPADSVAMNASDPQRSEITIQELSKQESQLIQRPMSSLNVSRHSRKSPSEYSKLIVTFPMPESTSHELCFTSSFQDSINRLQNRNNRKVIFSAINQKGMLSGLWNIIKDILSDAKEIILASGMAYCWNKMKKARQNNANTGNDPSREQAKSIL